MSPQWMSIANITPDSFSDGGRFTDEERLHAHLSEACSHGASIIDVGAESTRPGADEISDAEEWSRLKQIWPVLEDVKKTYPTTKISIDTRKAFVAQRALATGIVSIINDVSGGQYSGESMFKTVADAGCSYILMHNRGTPKTMDALNSYNNITVEVAGELNTQLAIAEATGIQRDKIWIDPGIGFAKNEAQSIQLIKELDILKEMLGGAKLVLGVSRKRVTLAGSTQSLEAQRREAPTSALHQWALSQLKAGTVNVIRTHDVPQQNAAWGLWESMLNF